MLHGLAVGCFHVLGPSFPDLRCPYAQARSFIGGKTPIGYDHGLSPKVPALGHRQCSLIIAGLCKRHGHSGDGFLEELLYPRHQLQGSLSCLTNLLRWCLPIV